MRKTSNEVHIESFTGLQQRRGLRGARRVQVREVGQRLQGRPGGRREAAISQAERGPAGDGVDGVRLLRADMRAGTIHSSCKTRTNSKLVSAVRICFVCRNHAVIYLNATNISAINRVLTAIDPKQNLPLASHQRCLHLSLKYNIHPPPELLFSNLFQVLLYVVGEKNKSQGLSPTTINVACK